MLLSNQTAIAGIGATDFSKDSGRSELQLAMEAIKAALDDAGLSPKDVDGAVTFTMDTNVEGEVLRNLGGPGLSYFGQVGYGGGGGGGAVLQAAMAVATGVARTVVVYRGMNERSGARFGQPMVQTQAYSDEILWSLHTMHGIQTAASLMALSMQRYMHETGATAEDFGRIAVAARKHAATNPKAWFYGKPIDMETYLASRMIADPLRLLDCCQESDGGVALIITSAERARDLRQKAVLIRAAAQGLPQGTSGLTSFYRPDITPRDESRMVADQLYAMAGFGPADIQAAIIYDHFGPSMLPALEAYGFCAYGEAKDFIKGGTIEIGGRLPLNTNGGQVGEAYIHGMNGFAEAVRQVRGTAANQVSGIVNVLATAGSGVPTSGMIVGAD